MKEISLGIASKLTSPNPLVMVCTRRPEGSTNMAPVSWWMYLTFKPGMIAFAMSQKSFSGECIRENNKAVLAIPGAAIADKVMKCGSSTGRMTDKTKEFGIETVDIPDSQDLIQVPMHSRVVMCCSVQKAEPVGDHMLYICNVDRVFSNDDETALFAWDGYGAAEPALRVEKRSGLSPISEDEE